MSTTWQTPISSFETNRRRVGALKSLGVVSVGDALTYYPFRVTEPVPARALREAKIGEKMAFAAHVRGVRVFPMARRGFRLIADVDDGDFARSRHMDASMASLVFFSYRKSYVDWIQRKLHEGALLVVAGEPSVYNDRLQFTHPDILTVDPAGEQLRSRSPEETAEWDDGFGTEQPGGSPAIADHAESQIRCGFRTGGDAPRMPPTSRLPRELAHLQRTHPRVDRKMHGPAVR